MNNREIDRLLADAVASCATPGTAAVVADANGLRYEGAAGKRALGGEADMSPDTVLYIASMTKAVTAVAAMQLVERGKLDLDTAGDGLLPLLGQVQVLEGFDDTGQPRLRPPRSRPTLRQLLTHTSGYTYEIWNADMLRYQQATDTPGVLGASYAALSVPLIADPGTRWEYGLGIAVAGLLVEAASGQKLGDYLQENILCPLGMNSTGFLITPEMRERLAQVHARTPEGLQPFPFEWDQEPEVQMGGEALYSTPRDYLRFLRMLLNKGEFEGQRVLQQQTVETMAQNHIGDLGVRHMRSAIPELGQDVDFFPGMAQKWGLSFLINTEAGPQGRSAGSLSWAGLSNCYYWIDYRRSVTGAIFNQIFPFFDDQCMRVYRDFESRVYASL